MCVECNYVICWINDLRFETMAKMFHGTLLVTASSNTVTLCIHNAHIHICTHDTYSSNVAATNWKWYATQRKLIQNFYQEPQNFICKLNNIFYDKRNAQWRILNPITAWRWCTHTIESNVNWVIDHTARHIFAIIFACWKSVFCVWMKFIGQQKNQNTEIFCATTNLFSAAPNPNPSHVSSVYFISVWWFFRIPFYITIKC